MHPVLEMVRLFRQLAPLVSVRGAGRRAHDVASQSLAELRRRRDADNARVA